MIKIEDIRAKQDELNKMIEEFAKQEEMQKDTYELEYPKKEDLENGYVFNYLLDGVERGLNRFENTLINLYKFGKWFATEKECVLRNERDGMLARFRQFRNKCNGDWVPDFYDENTKKYYIYYNYRKERLNVGFWTCTQDFDLFGHFKNKEDAQRAIKLFGDEIKALFVDMEV